MQSVPSLSLSLINLEKNVSEKKRSNLSFTVQQGVPKYSKGTLQRLSSHLLDESYSPILPGLHGDVSKLYLALVPRTNLPAVGVVCKRWRSFIRSKEFITIRKQAGMMEEWVYVLTMDEEGKESHWEVLDCFGNKHQVLPPMPGPLKSGSGVAVYNGKLLVIDGITVSEEAATASPDVYQYDSCLNSWNKLASMNVARYDFACAEVNGWCMQLEAMVRMVRVFPALRFTTLIQASGL